MKVLHVFDQIDAGERHQLLGMKARGVELMVVCARGAEFQADLEQAGIPVHHIQWRRRLDRQAIATLRELVRREVPDIVHVYVKRALSNVIRAIDDLPPRLVAYRGIVGNLHWLDPSSRRTFLHPRVDRIICVCEAIRQDLLANRLWGWHLPEHKVVTVHKGHYVDWWQNMAPPENLSEVGVPPEVPVIGCVAQMRKRKGVPVLVEALEQMENRRAHLVLIGRVGDRRVSRCIARSSVRERIHLLGWRQDAARLAGAFDVFVLPSLRREGLPRAVIEAMCQKVPPVVTNSGGSPELIEDGISGRVVPPGDAPALAMTLDQLLADDDLRRRMGEAAEARIRQAFQPERTVAETLAVYEDLMTPSN
ncbi:glycosyltransferase involved in cell wall biosynthesis [Natronospira proteinivora]|uniref:Glycosyltransferase involved in cell wall biosynthesis n=1 Tax=Natronospira proteinivora TaxID=1807133 RepID=A0ABT1G433_9GAMM|nr:glycosyltransferase [Natronospira proteinivora]MCP1726056.1 glycosyltransferase involved in cell wall biosynthesis [Natronospira proteinivora]